MVFTTIMRSLVQKITANKFTTAAALSLALHAGLTCFAVHKSFYSVPAVNTTGIGPTQTSPPPESKEERIKALKQNREAFVHRLLNDLLKGEVKISLFDFFITGETLDNNIAGLETGNDNSSKESDLRDKFSLILEEIKTKNTGAGTVARKLETIHQYAHENLWPEYLKASGQFSNALNDGSYNCFSSSAFIFAIADAIIDGGNFGITLFDPPKDPAKGKSGHARIWLQNQQGLWEIESVDGKKPVLTPFRGGFRVPKDIVIVAYLLRNGVNINQLPKRLRQYYLHGVSGSGFPVAGISTNLPDPPDSPIPNPYYKPDTAKIIRNAKIDRLSLALLEWGNSSPGDIALLPIPAGVDWCEEARFGITRNPSIPFHDFAHDYTINSDFDYIRYKTAVSAADILSHFGNQVKGNCTSEKEIKAFENYAIGVMEGTFTERSVNIERAIVNPAAARAALLRLSRQPNIKLGLRRQILANMRYARNLDDFELFAHELTATDNYKNRGSSILSLLELKGINPGRIKSVLLDALRKESDKLVKDWIRIGLARLGFGLEALELAQKEGVIKDHCREIAMNCKSLNPYGRSSDEEISALKRFIPGEEYYAARAYLIGLLAVAENSKAALSLYKQEILPLFDYSRNELIKSKTIRFLNDQEDWIDALGRIKSPEVETILLKIFARSPELAPAIGYQLFIHGFYNANVTDKLFQIMNDKSNPLDKRNSAALVLAMTGKI
ncbi:MAG: hypothetical protein WC624_04610 [Candidatus Margulisiibacteriota bacterium]